MIDKAFWEKISKEWRKEDDGIIIPDLDTGGAEGINPDDVSFDDLSDLDINDILADFDI